MPLSSPAPRLLPTAAPRLSVRPHRPGLGPRGLSWAGALQPPGGRRPGSQLRGAHGPTEETGQVQGAQRGCEAWPKAAGRPGGPRRWPWPSGVIRMQSLSSQQPRGRRAPSRAQHAAQTPGLVRAWGASAKSAPRAATLRDGLGPPRRPLPGQADARRGPASPCPGPLRSSRRTDRVVGGSGAQGPPTVPPHAGLQSPQKRGAPCAAPS